LVSTEVTTTVVTTSVVVVVLLYIDEVWEQVVEVELPDVAGRGAALVDTLEERLGVGRLKV
jgi:hypothetical protein